MVRFGGLLRREPAGVGHDVEQVVLLLKALADAVLVPVGVDGDVVHGLYAGGVVIQHDDLLVVQRDLGVQQFIGLRLVDRLPACQDLRIKRHLHYPFFSTFTSAMASKYFTIAE